ncbi:MAG: helix-turn-helix domain-containing protein [Candidatus Zixiibacteriota bacterium]|nr:MAG: helix-turn-helix domain-containing protein [candidate division Zixibacteria bacterium]
MASNLLLIILTTIADVANHWGFWHMGQFSADYRRLFGELPLETLRRGNGRSQ